MELFRAIDSGQVQGDRPETADGFEDAVLIAQTVVVRRRGNILTGRAGALGDPIDEPRVRVGKRADENRIGDAENRSGGADGKGQRGGSGKREKRVAAQSAERVAEIFEEVFDQ